MTYQMQLLVLVLCSYFAGLGLGSAHAQEAPGAEPLSAPAPSADVETALDAEEITTLNGIPGRTREQTALAEGMLVRVAEIKANNTITGKQAAQYGSVLRAQIAQLAAAEKVAAKLRSRNARPAGARGDLRYDLEALEKQLDGIAKTIDAVKGQITDLAIDTGWSLVDKLLAARCTTAICFANGDSKYWLGIEPLVELPVGFSSALGDTGLAQYINNHELRVDLAAGLRVWLFGDLVSISIYLSKPLIDSNIRIEGSSFVYPGSAVRRPFPGFALGVFFDSLWIGFDRNELRNGGSDNAMSFNSDYPPNVVVSSAWTITVALQPITAFRTALGTANKASEED